MPMSPADPISVDRAAAPLLEARALAIAGRLSPLDLRWHGGQLVALLGPNGSGKSTLLGALAGILPAEGSVLLGGDVLTDLSWPELAKRRAMLPQRQPQLFHIPVFQVLSLGLDQGVAPARQNEAIRALCEALELEALLPRDFSRLSGGEQQRVLIARTLLQLWPSLNPTGRVLLLDEPLAGLDLHHQLALLRLLKTLAREGLLVVLAIHDINLAIDWADRILCLQQGRVVSEGGVDVIDEALLERVFQIKTDRVEAAGRVWFMPSL
jgi:vitamin B12 transport system ATP-binding protein